MKEEIKKVFNQKENMDGSKIKIMLGSPSIKEGVSLLRVEEIHILEPYWNLSRIQQIIGRGIRFCSHKDLPKYKQVVNVYLYLATHQKEEQTIDEYIWSLAKNKNKLIEQFEQILKENAIDCELFHTRNYYKTDEQKLICNK
jgi:superfamily II DNA or RNA helicase